LADKAKKYAKIIGRFWQKSYICIIEIIFLFVFIQNLILIMAYVITDKCVACGTCLPVCPVEAISEGDIYHIDPDTCIECGSCAEVCPSEAIVPGE
jgi:hypothetical protein